MAQNISPDNLNGSTKQCVDSVAIKDNHCVSKRLQKELMTLMLNTESDISAFPDGENMLKWIGTITGPPDTVYDGQKYRLSLEFPNSYPYAPPVVKFLTPCFHPNIDLTYGVVCLDILKERWSALFDVRTILLSLQSLLGEPNTDSPLNAQAALMWADQEKLKKFIEHFYEQHKD